MSAPRTRMTPEDRRKQILRVAAGEFASNAYHDVRMSDIAARAGVSRALIYRYYPTKRDLFAAFYEHTAHTLVDASTVKPGVGLSEQVRIGLDAHFDFFEANARSVLVANRGELAGDARIEAIITAQLAELRHAMLDTLSVTGHEREVASVALHGWLSFVRAACVEWLAKRGVTRQEVYDQCLRVLSAALGSAADV